MQVTLVTGVRMAIIMAMHRRLSSYWIAVIRVIVASIPCDWNSKFTF